MFELKELNMNMDLPEYEMYQDIPLKESGSTNLCNGLPYDVFKNYLESQIARKYQSVSLYDTPTIIYIMYVGNIPIGYIGIRTEIDDNWKKWCGNIYYAIRLSERRKGYATKMMELALK
jgi:predicted acetyltransferase